MTETPRILLVGGGGFLGRAFHRHLARENIEHLASARNPEAGQLKLDLLLPVARQIEPALENKKFTHGIICAAITDIEACFRDPEGSHRVNIAAMMELLECFDRFGITPIFFSSDLVFSNTAEHYAESDSPSPTTLYGRQKLAVEEMIRKQFPRHLIFRTSKQMSLRADKRNILSQVIDRLQRNEPVDSFQDQFITPVFIEDVAEVAERAIRTGSNGTFHLAAEERISRLEIARRICDRMDKPKELIRPISMADIKFSEPRGRIYTINSEKIRRALGFGFRNIESGLISLLPRNP